MPFRAQKQLLYHQQKQTLDYLLQQRIGYGEAQHKLALPLYILLFTEGCESIVISLLLPQLQLEWNISILEKSFLITAIFCGVGFGTYIQSYADEFGRQIFIKRNTIFQTLAGLFSCIAPSMPFLILFRFLYGIGVGVAFPLSRKYISQITPTQSRLILLTRLRTYFAIGCLFAYLAAWYLLQNHNWRMLLFIICIPSIYGLYEIGQNGKQSLRYLWYNNKAHDAYQLILYMTKHNGREEISREEVDYLMSFKKGDDVGQIEYKHLLDPRFRKLTFTLMFAWFSIFFIYYGVFLFLPTILQNNTFVNTHHSKYLIVINQYRYITLCTVVVFEIVSSLLSRPIMEHELFGRKKTLYFSLFMVGLFSLSLMVAQQNDFLNFVISFIGVKMFITLSFMVYVFLYMKTIFPYTVEIYSTLMKKKQKGIFLASGRVGTILLGFLGLNAIYWLNGDALYLIFAILSISTGYMMAKLPFDSNSRMSDISFFFS